MVLASFLIPEKVATATIAAGPVKMQVVPTAGGMGAVGTFRSRARSPRARAPRGGAVARWRGGKKSCHSVAERSCAAGSPAMDRRSSTSG